LTHTTVLTRIPAVVNTVPYHQGDLNPWIQLRYGTAQGCILTVRSTAVAVYSTVDSPNSWILPSIITSCSHIYPHHWDAVPSTTNGGESQHHWTNTQTSTRLTLLEAIALFVILPYLTCHHSLDFSIERTKLIEKPPMSFATHSSNEHKSTLAMTFSTACLETLSGVQILLKSEGT